MKEYIEREAVLRPLKAKCDIMGTSQTYTAHAKEQAYWDAYTTVQQFPAAPVDALVKAAREVANADTDVQLRYGIFRLEAALAAVDGGGQ